MALLKMPSGMSRFIMRYAAFCVLKGHVSVLETWPSVKRWMPRCYAAYGCRMWLVCAQACRLVFPQACYKCGILLPRSPEPLSVFISALHEA